MDIKIINYINKQIKKKTLSCGTTTPREDQVICMFAEYLANHDRHITFDCKLIVMTGSKKYRPVDTKPRPVWGSIYDQRKFEFFDLPPPGSPSSDLFSYYRKDKIRN